MATQTTPALAVTAVTRAGVTIHADGRTSEVTWTVLHNACAQDDQIACYYRSIAVPPQDEETQRLASTYRLLRNQAHRLVVARRDLPIVLDLQDDTNTGYRWELTAQTVDGIGFPLRGEGIVSASEGGTTLYVEAHELREAVRARLIRHGYTDVRIGRG